MTISVPISWSAGQVLAAADLNTVNAYWATSFGTIKRENFGANPGIISTDLADRYCIVTIPVEIYPINQAILYTPVLFNVPGVLTDVWKHTWRWYASKRAYIFDIEYYVLGVTTGIQISTYLGSTLIGSNPVIIAASDSYGYIRNSSASAASSPQIPIADTQELKVAINQNGGASTARGVSGIIRIKAELGP